MKKTLKRLCWKFSWVIL